MSPTRTHTRPVDELGRGAALKRTITEAHVVLDLLLADELKALGLTVGEADVLTVVAINRAPLTPGQIAAQLPVTGPGLTGRLNSLSHSGHLERHRNPADGRSITVHLTRSGRHLAAAVTEAKDSTLVSSVAGELGDGAVDEIVSRLDMFIALASRKLAADTSTPPAARSSPPVGPQ